MDGGSQDNPNNREARSTGGNGENTQGQMASPEKAEDLSYMDETGTDHTGAKKTRAPKPQPRQKAGSPGLDDLSGGQKNFGDEDLKSMYPQSMQQRPQTGSPGPDDLSGDQKNFGDEDLKSMFPQPNMDRSSQDNPNNREARSTGGNGENTQGQMVTPEQTEDLSYMNETGTDHKGAKKKRAPKPPVQPRQNAGPLGPDDAKSILSSNGSGMAEGLNSNVREMTRMMPAEITENLNDIKETYDSINLDNQETVRASAGLSFDRAEKEKQITASVGFDPKNQFDEKTEKDGLRKPKKSTTTDADVDDLSTKMDNLNIGVKHDAGGIPAVQPSVNTDKNQVANAEKGFSKSMKNLDKEEGSRVYLHPENKHSINHGEAKKPPEIECKKLPLDEKGPLIRHLRLDLELKKQFPDIQVYVNSECIELRGPAGILPETEKRLDHLMSSIHKVKKSFRKPHIALLNQPEVQQHMFDELEKSDIRCHWKVNDSEPDTVYFFALSIDTIEMAAQFLKNNFFIRSDVDSELATELLLKFSGKCQKWAAGVEETHVSLIFTKDIAEEVNSVLAAAVKERSIEVAELKHQAEIEKEAKEQGNLKAKEPKRPEKVKAVSVEEVQAKQTGTLQSQYPPAMKSSAEIPKPSSELGTDKVIHSDTSRDVADHSNVADKGSESEESYPYDHTFIPMEHCLAEFITQQKEISEIKSKLNVSIINNCGKIIAIGGEKEQRVEALRQIEALALDSHLDFILKSDPVERNSDDWHNIEKEAKVSNVSIAIRQIEHKPLRDQELYKVEDVEICVGHGCISDIKAVDMIVVPVNRCLFPITPASELFFKVGGEKLVEETKMLFTKYVNSNRNSRLPIGHLQISNVVGNLPCNFIAYIVVGETFADDVYIEKKLMEKLCYILDEVKWKKQTSIALPLELSRTFPVQKSSKIIANVVKQTITDKSTPLKDICLCAENKENLILAKEVFEKEFGSLDENVMVIIDKFEETDDQQNYVKVDIVTGSLVEQKVDAIVCIINEWNLRHGVIAREILDKGGEQIEQDLQSFDRPTLGEVVTVKAGNLPCGHIIFGSLPSMKQTSEPYALENLKFFLKNCFKMAKARKCNSLAFPVLGTGKLQYPALLVAKEMLRAAHFYAAPNGVEEVRIVLLKDDNNKEDFSKLHGRFQDMQKHLVEEEDSWTYLDVKIADLETKITVVEGKDREAFASNIIVKTMQLQQGGKAWDVKEDEPSSHVLNTAYFSMYFCPSPTDSDFKACLRDVLCKLEKKGCVHATFDFSQGLEGFHNYIELTIDMLKSNYLKKVEKLTIVSDQGMFQKLLDKYSQTPTEATNTTLPGKVAGMFSSLLSKPAFTVTVKEHKTKPYGGALTSWLTVLCARDAQKLQTIRQKIDKHCKTSVGSSVDDRNLDSEELFLREHSVKRKDTARASTSGTKKIQAEVARGSSDLTDTGDSTDVTDTGDSESGAPLEDEEDSGDEVFGMVETMLPVDSDLVKRLDKSLSEMGGQIARERSHGAKKCLTFDFYERHDVQNALLKLKDEGLLYVIEDVDDSLYQLFLLYMEESKGFNQVKKENITREGNKVHVNDIPEVFDVVKSKIKSLRGWNTETVGFKTELYSKAVAAVEKLKSENQNVIVKLLDNEIQISGASEHTGPAKHRVSIELGIIKTTGRRRRQFTEDYPSLPLQQSLEPAKSLEPVVPLSAPVVSDSSNSLESVYQTNEGITVKVYKGSITKLPVECIVNAANENLSHGAGVAAAISRAAGPDFQKESSQTVQIYGKVPETMCAKTSAGLLNYKYVIHAVGPRFSQVSSSSVDVDAENLKKTVINALKMAEDEGMTSVALPSISAGIFGGTPDLCADMYAWGVIDFSRSNNGQHPLKEIHFVDIQESLVKTIQSKFDLAFTLMNADPSSKSINSISLRADTVRVNTRETLRIKADVTMKGTAVTGTDSSDDKHGSIHDKHGSIHSHKGGSYSSMIEFGTGSTMKLHALPFRGDETRLSLLEEDKNRPSLRCEDNELKKETSPNRYQKQGSAEISNAYGGAGSKREVQGQGNNDLRITVINKPPEPHVKPKSYAQATSPGSSGGEMPKSPVKSDPGPSKTFDEPLKFTFPRRGGIEVTVQQADISLLNVDAVVCPESLNCRGDGSIAKSIQAVLNNKSIWNDAQRRNPQPLSAFKSPVRPDMPYKNVMLVFSPRWTRATAKGKFDTELRTCIQNIFEKLKYADVKSLSLPVLGIGDGTTPYRLCCEIVCDEISKLMVSNYTKLTNVYITSTFRNTVLDLKDILTKELVGSVEQTGGYGKKDDSWKKKCNKCFKEMDATDPTVNTCQRCLHKSPKQQVETLPTRSFTPRNVHPACTMSQEVLQLKLHGYDCNTIKITYEFSSGTQRTGDPYPGRSYHGCKKYAYLPNNEGGLIVFHLFKKALAKSMVFKVDKHSLVQWSGQVEHKTSLTAGDRYGFPDTGYLERVMNRLSSLRESSI